MRLRSTVALSILIVVSASYLAFNDTRDTPVVDRYANWPAAGTQPGTVSANAAVAITCEDGRPVVESNMIQPTDKPTYISDYGDFYLRIITDKQCEVGWHAFSAVSNQHGSHANTMTVTTLRLARGATTWSKHNDCVITNGGICLFLFNIDRLPKGPIVMNGPNGLPAPARTILEGTYFKVPSGHHKIIRVKRTPVAGVLFT